MLLVAITCTERDVLDNSSRLCKSIENFHRVFHDNVLILIICQSKNIDISIVEDLFKSFSGIKLEVVKIDYFSVSNARNYALSFGKKVYFDYLIFHDSSLVYSDSYLLWVKSNLCGNLLSSDFLFTNKLGYGGGCVGQSCVLFKDLEDLYVWSYVFPLNKKFPLFDERFGPGEKSIYASGEDFLFLRSFFKLNPECREFLRFKGGGIFHPPRPADYSKHLAYAEGQGKIHQIFLREEKSLYAFWRCMLFLGNGVLRVLILKKNSAKILFLRLKGFFSSTVKI